MLSQRSYFSVFVTLLLVWNPIYAYQATPASHRSRAAFFRDAVGATALVTAGRRTANAAEDAAATAPALLTVSSDAPPSTTSTLSPPGGFFAKSERTKAREEAFVPGEEFCICDSSGKCKGENCGGLKRPDIKFLDKVAADQEAEAAALRSSISGLKKK